MRRTRALVVVPVLALAGVSGAVASSSQGAPASPAGQSVGAASAGELAERLSRAKQEQLRALGGPRKMARRDSSTTLDQHCVCPVVVLRKRGRP